MRCWAINGNMMAFLWLWVCCSFHENIYWINFRSDLIIKKHFANPNWIQHINYIKHHRAQPPIFIAIKLFCGISGPNLMKIIVQFHEIDSLKFSLPNVVIKHQCPHQINPNIRMQTFAKYSYIYNRHTYVSIYMEIGTLYRHTIHLLMKITHANCFERKFWIRN